MDIQTALAAAQKRFDAAQRAHERAVHELHQALGAVQALAALAAAQPTRREGSEGDVASVE